MAKMPIPLAQGQVTGAVAAMVSKPAKKTRRKRKTTRKPAARRKTTRRAKRKTGRLKKGSPEAKRRMAQLRRMRKKR